MFGLQLAELARTGRVQISGEIPADSSHWDELELRLQGPLRVRLVATAGAAGEVIVRGEMEGVVQGECRRCLASVSLPVLERLELVWILPDEAGDVDDGEVRILDPTTTVLELAPALREEFLLAAPRYVLCREDCRGLCPRCGANRNEEGCDCSPAEPDPRWAVLRTLKTE